MKEYYCREIRGDGDECGETRKEKFYSGIKSACKYCQSKKVYKKEKEKKEKEAGEEDEAVSSQMVLDKLGEDIEKKFKTYDKKFEMYDKAYTLTKDKINEMTNEIEELQKLTKELKSQNKELVKANDIYKNKIKSLESENRLLNESVINLDKRVGNYECRNYLREDNPYKEGFENFKDLKSLRK